MSPSYLQEDRLAEICKLQYIVDDISLKNIENLLVFLRVVCQC